jgi:hypothetical protein
MGYRRICGWCPGKSSRWVIMTGNTFGAATYTQLSRLLTVVDTKPNRNWDWLIAWMDGEYDDLYFLDLSEVENVVNLFEQDEEWK